MNALRKAIRNAIRHLTQSALSWLLVGGVVAGCGVTDEDALPPYLDNPANVQTPNGALARYRGAFDSLPFAFAYVVRDGNAIVTDELTALPLPFGAVTPYTAIDSRNDLSGTGTVTGFQAYDGITQVYRRLHVLRAQAREARGLMATYISGGAPELRGHLYALEGYAELFLADVFCSGIPLSTVDFNGDYTLAAGSTTKEVYAHARALFDSALALTGDSLEFGYWAAVGKGRALLALDSADAAAAAGAAVPTSFQYQTIVPANAASWFSPNVTTVGPIQAGALGVGDREGVNGIDYRSSGDPRTPVDTLPCCTGNRASRDGFNNLLYVPDTLTYPLSSSSTTSGQTSSPATFTLADGIEARLVEAEAALRSGGPWLAMLNQLRSTVGLADTTDPGTPSAQVDLLFRERAFWLYLTGHRLGDLRRLVRPPYGRNPDTVFPSRSYPGGTGQYGHQIVFPVPESERTFNPKYTGCIDFNA